MPFGDFRRWPLAEPVITLIGVLSNRTYAIGVFAFGKAVLYFYGVQFFRAARKNCIQKIDKYHAAAGKSGMQVTA
jgi:hypothetical protein